MLEIVTKYRRVTHVCMIWSYNVSTMNPVFLTVTEVAAQLRVNPVTVRRWIADAKLPAIKAGSHYRIAQAEVDNLMTPTQS